MKIALGIHVGHDRGAAIIKDGSVLGAISQERLDRVKYSRSANIPVESIDSLLKYLNLSFNDISCVGISYHAIEGVSVERYYQEQLENIYGVSHIPIYFVNHHTAHAYSAYFSSGFDDALIVVADGAGDYIDGMQEAESLFIAKNNKIKVVCRRMQHPAVGKVSEERNHVFPLISSFVQNYEISLGRKYSQMTYLLGFGSGASGKTMGLAGYGKPLFDFNAYKKNDFFNFSLTYKDLLEDISVLSVMSGKTHKEYLRDERANIASTLQLMLENTMIDLIDDILDKYSCNNLVLAGGVFLNCLLNHKIMKRFDDNNFFVIPATGDDGQALGCAYYAYENYFGLKDKFTIHLPYLGISYNDVDIEKSLKDANLSYTKLTDDVLAKEIAKRISENKIVALHRGRTEIGPRALCHRSILANATNPNIKDILNKKVKHREPFRPFAPSVISGEQFKYFDLKFESNYMLMATMVKEKYKNQLLGITHVDGTARVQAVSNKSEPFVHKTLLEIKKLIGFPVVVNTSFNVNSEPIVESPSDAIETFLKTQIDTLVIGNFIVDKV